MAELFQTSKRNVSLNLQRIHEEGELQEEATVKEYLTVQTEETLSLRDHSLDRQAMDPRPRIVYAGFSVQERTC